MNNRASDAVTAMLNCFPQTAQDYDLWLETLERLCAGLTDQAVIEAAQRFAAGDVAEQSMKFSPSTAEFVHEARRRQELIDIKARPRLPPPQYFPGPLAPFQVRQQKRLAENSHLPVISENATFEEFRRMSAAKQIPVGARFVASLGIIYGPPPSPLAQRVTNLAPSEIETVADSGHMG
jgi:hypothetical protein